MTSRFKKPVLACVAALLLSPVPADAQRWNDLEQALEGRGARLAPDGRESA